MGMQEALEAVNGWGRSINETIVLIETASGSVYVAQVNPVTDYIVLRQMEGDTLERFTGEWLPFWNLVAMESSVRTHRIRMFLEHQWTKQRFAIDTASVVDAKAIPSGWRSIVA